MSSDPQSHTANEMHNLSESDILHIPVDTATGNANSRTYSQTQQLIL